MILSNGEVSASHSKNLVPFILLQANTQKTELQKTGTLADIAPTICELLKIKTPIEMTGKSLLKHN